jgi:hypothetical protein
VTTDPVHVVTHHGGPGTDLAHEVAAVVAALAVLRAAARRGTASRRLTAGRGWGDPAQGFRAPLRPGPVAWNSPAGRLR